MTEEQYKKLNNYFDLMSKQLEKNDHFLLENLSAIAYTSEDFMYFIKQYDFREENKENNLTYEQVYQTGRLIIADINDKYLSIYDQLIEDGTLDFNYQMDNSGCWCYTENQKILLDIERNFSYADVVTLIHEFIHYTNRNSNKISNNRYLFTEFLSIYFEIYTQKYLIEKYNAPKESIGIYRRLKDCQKCSNDINSISIPFFAYLKTGNLNSNSNEFTNEYFIHESKESFEKECLNILKYFEKIEKEYHFKILYEKEFSEDELGNFFVNKSGINKSYRYLLGTLLAYYAMNYLDMKILIQLNDSINSYAASQASAIKLLYQNRIDLNDDFMNKTLNYIKTVLENNTKIR